MPNHPALDNNDWSIAWKIAAIYFVMGSAWILLTDWLLLRYLVDSSLLTLLQSVKGFFFVIVTAIVLFYIVRKHLTNLWQSQMELAVREELFRTVQETSLEGFIILSPVYDDKGQIENFEVVYCNPEAARLMNTSVERLIGQRMSTMGISHCSRDLHKEYTGVLETGEPSYFEISIPTDGEQLWFKNMAVKTGDGLAVCFSEITEQKKAAEELRQERDFSKSIVDNASTIITMWALDGTITLFNKYAEEVTGFTAEEVIGKSFIDCLVPEWDKDYAREFLKKVQRGEDISTGESRWHSSAGEIIHILWTQTPAFDSKGNIIAIVSMGIDITERKQAERTISHMAYHDPLTDLPNRALLNDRLKLALAQARRYKKLLAVMYIDLDRFKLINDTMGHAMGDLVLKDVARRLTGCLREGDTVARIGGDEFVLVFPSITREEDVSKIALKLIQVLKAPFEVQGQEFHLTTSIGIALYPHDGKDSEDLLKNADAALYRAKEEGNTYRLYTPAMNEKALERLDLERDLCRALEQEEFLVFYQPQVNVATGKITGMEALVRWKHPIRGLVFPGDFIQIAEETGLIVSIGEWVLRTACAQNRNWQNMGYPELRVVVNLSARQFAQHDLAEVVSRALQETGLAPQWLELEITESVVMKDLEYTVRVLNELREMGVHIAVDDFGTGYSSLNYLKQFPINTIKIDQSFVRGIVNSEEDAAIVATIIVLTQNLKLKAIAEGVENIEQFEFLRRQLCNDMQGYLFSKPVPPEEFEALLKKGIIAAFSQNSQ